MQARASNIIIQCVVDLVLREYLANIELCGENNRIASIMKKEYLKWKKEHELFHDSKTMHYPLAF